MDITSLTSSDLKRISALLKDKEKLQAQLDKINAALRALGGGAPAAKPARASAAPAPAAAPRAKKAGSRKATAGRGALMDQIVKELQEAAGKGVHIKDLSTRLGVKVANLRVWFLTTGKKIKAIRKVEKATFAWKP